ncbi:Bifunctional pantoate ligase/cytidylate kinase [Hyella patelloides LEGE 07179]|uniref:Bifunctional pantoate ligase/cytidylate kinase n=1 Tax=Hyella patelloides LEGE 07179 TaxID=945734 RepID=A0A563W458_9CYAN|nr:bifunctional pantoate--beta-alanine ligase/(d)CMP kinase [Hyella patelloides]VEP18464.1 Bifunctional pantoate ligase/cytidylate kinase [Hyella patelloides LEGE 07179]
MLIIYNLLELRTALNNIKLKEKQVGLVPTMGALHQGHISLIKRAISECDAVVVSIFVNPLQFAPHEDLAQYPRNVEADCQLCEKLGVKIVFAPSVEEIGVTGDTETQTNTTTVIPPESMTSGLCGKYRPGHFIGVATIVTKLLNIVQPDRAYFGQKDAQQLAIIRRLVIDFNLPVNIVGCQIVREESGLALSSRNQYLTPEEKTQATILHRSLQQAAIAFRKGIKETASLIKTVKNQLATIPEVKMQYVELVDPATLQPLTIVEKTGLLAIAAHLGKTRLIDNIILRQPIVAIDGPAGAGKSTVTRRVAKELGLLYLDTGAMYRAVTWLVMNSQIVVDDESAVAKIVKGVKIDLIPGNTPHLPVEVYINQQEVTQAIRTPEVTANVSAISAQAAVRKELVQAQQNYGVEGGIIAEGRDIGTNVFPDAELKIFLTASPQERAKRRLSDLQNQGYKDINLKQLEQEIIERDNKDSNRAIAPLKKADDAIEIITDRLSIEEVINKIKELYSNL